MSAMKIIGALLLAGSGAALGFERSACVRRHVRLLAALTAALGVMGEEISLLRTPLPELFAGLAGRGPAQTRTFFASLSDTDGRPLSERWSESVQALPLDGEARETLCALGMSLGRYDAGAQCAQIELTCAQLRRMTQEARIERDGRARTYVGLGLSLGAMLAVILL